MFIIYILIGGFLGGIARYALSSWILQNIKTEFPLGTFVVNCLGSALAGTFLASGILLSKSADADLLEAFVLIGFLGSMTTFSSFSLDGYRLIAQNKVTSAIIYSIATPLCALAGFALIFLINALTGTDGGALN